VAELGLIVSVDSDEVVGRMFVMLASMLGVESVDSDEVVGRMFVMLASMLGVESVDSDEVVGKVFVMLASIEPGDETPRLDGKVAEEDGRSVSKVVDVTELPVKLLVPDTTGGRVVTEGGRAEVDARGFVTIGIRSTMGLPSDPSVTTRLAVMMTVVVPLRTVSVGGTPSPFVKVQSPSA
jgi:hypothetical protein